MPKAYTIIGVIGIFLMLFAGVSLAIDPDHDTTHSVNCNSCHILHGALGSSLTKVASNSNLCISCHTSGAGAAVWPFASGDQAIPGTSGTSHSWSGNMPLTDNPNNAYGLRSVNSITDAALKAKLSLFGTCNLGSSYTNKTACETATGVWTATVTCSVCHAVHSQSASTWDPSAPAYGGAGTGHGRHMQRDNNDLNQLCEDCHYYRTPASGETNVTTWDGHNKSHNIAMVLSGTSYNSAPLDMPSCSNPIYTTKSACLQNSGTWTWPAQTGSRYELNGTGDTNLTNNIVFDSTQKVRCLSCHGMHYTDSDSSTVDQP